ncbi:Uncharacterized protein DBV15_09232 [Temnothorax longispinosus]|uniref:Uncharacterized protein n=1 Tax=Temnothorax longispinosus TaxID=300112 RepID=A0A4S2KVT2_9HYME|nr:Uncharacterized protein DBV15_09232 [Temnothorax longispinosus]
MAVATLNMIAKLGIARSCFAALQINTKGRWQVEYKFPYLVWKTNNAKSLYLCDDAERVSPRGRGARQTTLFPRGDTENSGLGWFLARAAVYRREAKASPRSQCPPHGQRPHAEACMAKSMGENGRYWERDARSGPNDGETAKCGGSGLSEDIEEMNGNGCRAKLYRDNYLLTALYLAQAAVVKNHVHLQLDG